MDNSHNYSQFSDLLVFENSTRNEIHRSEPIPNENFLTIEDLQTESMYITPELEKEY